MRNAEDALYAGQVIAEAGNMAGAILEAALNVARSGFSTLEHRTTLVQRMEHYRDEASRLELANLDVRVHDFFVQFAKLIELLKEDAGWERLETQASRCVAAFGEELAGQFRALVDEQYK